MKNSIFLFLLIFLFSCGSPIPRKPVIRKTSSVMNESIEFNKSLNAVEENTFELLMKRDSLNTYKASTNGFWYTFNLKSSEKYLPKFGDQLIYSYEVYDTNNKVIYGSEEIGEQTYLVDQQEIIEGLRNGLKLMNEGDIVTFLFPSHQVYGYLGDSKKIEINQPLIYQVQLKKINKKNENN